jgi:adenine-specific DNA-methyltransferase
MPTVDQQRQKLLALLKELFQINQPDLDFGFYRIMHAKADEVSRFLDQDLLQIIADAFGESSSEKQADLKKSLSG